VQMPHDGNQGRKEGRWPQAVNLTCVCIFRLDGVE
jgi:hypothetical protein